MKKGKYFIVFLLLLLALIFSCGKKIVPSSVFGRADKNYDSAAFNYVYVEAIKQKLMGNAGDALRYLEQCIKIKPEGDAAYYQIAQIMIGNGDNKNGKRYLNKALSINQKNVWYLMMLAGIYYQEKNLDSAIIYYEKAVKYSPERENLKLTLGNLYTENRKFDKAFSVFDDFVKRYGANESFTLSATKSLMAAGKYEEALLKIQSLIKESPDEIVYNGLLAEIYRGKGENDKAHEVYERLNERNPENPLTQLSICDFLITEKNYEELFKFLNIVILNNNVNREDKIALVARLLEQPEIIKDQGDRLMLAVMLLEANYKNDNIFLLFRPELMIKQEKLVEASIRLEEIIKMSPENYYAWERLLLIYLQLKDYNKLFSKGDECATLFNRSFLAKILYANGALELEKFDVALEELRKAEILAGNNKDSIVQVLTMRADTYYRMKDYMKAFEIFEETLRTNKNDLTVINNYAYYLAEQNTRLREAEEMAKRVIEEEKGNNTYLDTYAWVLYKRGKLKQAAEIMETIIGSGDKPDAVWYEHYGYILKKQRKCPKAIENWNIAVGIDSSLTSLKKEIESCEK